MSRKDRIVDRPEVVGYQGQGTQEISMGSELLDYPEAQEVLDEANQITEVLIGSKISSVLEGPLEKLNENSQLAIFTVSAMSTAVLFNRVKKHPFGVTGHSLGEYAALLAASTLSLKSGLELVHERQKAMDEANKQIPGGGAMAAVTGLTEEQILGVARNLDVDMAALNTDTSGTLSGPKERLAGLQSEIEQVGSGRGVPLAIFGAAHSRWNALAAERIAPILNEIEFKSPKFHFFANDGRVIDSPEEIKLHLLRMFEKPVLFRDVSRRMEKTGVELFTEVGKPLLSKFVTRTTGSRIATQTLGKLLSKHNK